MEDKTKKEVEDPPLPEDPNPHTLSNSFLAETQDIQTILKDAALAETYIGEGETLPFEETTELSSTLDETITKEDSGTLARLQRTVGLRGELSPNSTLNPIYESRESTFGDDETLDGGETAVQKAERFEEFKQKLSELPVVQLTGSLGRKTSENESPQQATLPQEASLSDVELLELLGEGGMGQVALAHQHALNRKIALKRVKPTHITSKTLQALFREASLAGVLEHPNIVPIYALGKDEDAHPVLMMKKVEGVTWKEMIRNPKHTKWSTVHTDPMRWHLEVLMQICNAVQFAHNKKTLHRDIKPENVMIGDFGEVYLLDWGLGLQLDERSALQSQEVVGTPAYMAPEMLQGTTPLLSERTDIYLLGASLHEALTGKSRHSGTTVQSVILSVFHSEPFEYPEDIPKELAELCNKATHPTPEERFATVQEFKQAIADFLLHLESIQISQAANARLIELQEAISQQHTEEHSIIHKLFYECRFGFEQALRSWPHNSEAKDSLQKALKAMCQFQLSQKEYNLAHALYEELDGEHPELASSLAYLKEERQAQTQAQKKLKELEYQWDPNVARKQRTMVIGGFFGILTLFVTFIIGLSYWNRELIKLENLTTFPIVFLSAMAITLLIFRKILFKTKLNRQIFFSILLLMVGVASHRVLCYLLGIKLNHMLMVDLLIVSGMTALMGISIRKLFFVPSGICFSAAFVASQMQAYAPAFIAGSFLLSAGVFGISFLRQQQKQTSQAQ